MEQTFRNNRAPMRSGDKVFLTGMVVEVLDVTAEGHPARVSFTFDISLENESIAWIDWQPGGFVSWRPPAVGSTLELLPAPIHLF